MGVGVEPLEIHRSALVGHCYRMLGSAAEADDAVQETLLRAWRAFEGFDGRSSVRTWLHRIATNVCLDQLRSRSRRELPTALGSAGSPLDELEFRPEATWLEPIPDALAVPHDSPSESASIHRQALRLAFVAALQYLPPRQRAALLLKDVVGFSSAEIAATLETTPASINSALQRARKTLAEHDVSSVFDAGSLELSATQQSVVERFVDAFHAYDVDALVSLLREDAVTNMPPITLWLRGRSDIKDWMLGRGIGCRGSRLVPTRASGSVAFGQYRLVDARHEAWALIVLDLDECNIRTMTYFLSVDSLFPRFGLPLALR